MQTRLDADPPSRMPIPLDAGHVTCDTFWEATPPPPPVNTMTHNLAPNFVLRAVKINFNTFLQQNAIPHRESDSNCTVSPPNGTATVDTWNVSCTGFKDDRGVLWYKLQCKSEFTSNESQPVILTDKKWVAWQQMGMFTLK